MNKLKFNPDNAKYYSEEFIKGFECGVERQYNADMAEKTAKWIFYIADNDGMEEKWCKCSKCGYKEFYLPPKRSICPSCKARMK